MIRSFVPLAVKSPHSLLVPQWVCVMDIGYFSYFLSLYLLDKETQCDTYLNPCSEFTLNFLDSIYSQMTPFRKQSFLLELEPLSSDYALFSNHNHGYADLSKR